MAPEKIVATSKALGYVDVQFKELGATRLREHLSEAEIDKLAADGARLSEDQAVEEALKV